MNHTGSCACGAINFEVEGELPGPDACHCSQCRKFSGHYFVSTDVPKKALSIDGADKLTWYQSPVRKVRRGFCSVCGSSLFWEPTEHDWIGVAMGAFDGATDTGMHLHIYLAEKGDYYELTDDLPKFARTPRD